MGKSNVRQFSEEKVKVGKSSIFSLGVQEETGPAYSLGACNDVLGVSEWAR